MNIKITETFSRELSYENESEKKADPKPARLKDLLRKVYDIFIIFLPFVTKVS